MKSLKKVKRMVIMNKITNLNMNNPMKYFIGLFFVFVCTAFESFSQVKIDTVYITYIGGEKETTMNKATYYRVRKYAADTLYADEYRIKDSSLANSSYFKSFSPSVREGLCIVYSDSGYMATQGQYLANKKTGVWINYYPNESIWYTRTYLEGKDYGTMLSYYKTGELKRRCEYLDDVLIIGKCFTRSGADTTYYSLFVPPTFQGGNAEMVRYFKKYLKYPSEAMKYKLEGKVMVICTVKKDGTLDDVHVNPAMNSYYILNDDAVDFVKKMPKWNPGYEDGILIEIVPYEYR